MRTNRIADPPDPWWAVPAYLYAALMLADVALAALAGAVWIGVPIPFPSKAVGIPGLLLWFALHAVLMAWMDEEAVRLEEDLRDLLD